MSHAIAGQVIVLLFLFLSIFLKTLHCLDLKQIFFPPYLYHWLQRKVGGFRLGNIEVLLNNGIHMIFLEWNYTKENRRCSQLQYRACLLLLTVLKHVTSLAFQLDREKWEAEEAE